MKKVLITSRSFGKVSSEPLELLKNAGFEVDRMSSDYTDEKFDKAILDYDGIIIGAHRFLPEVMEKCNKLQIIAKHGVGLENIDIPKAKELGITVTNVPAMNANAVADLAIAHMLNLCRGLSVSAQKVKEGIWDSYIGRDMYSKTLGLIGFGAIAKNVALRARGFSMDIIAYDPYIKNVPEEYADFVKLGTLNQIIEKSDFISIHVPLTEETRNMIDKENMFLMKKDAYLINTGRGGIINEEDLYDVLVSGHLGGAALDVTSLEPIEKDNPLLSLENCIISPHIGMYSFEAINALSMVCAKNVVAKLSGERPDFVVV